MSVKRMFAFLLHLYPKSFRREYGREMMQVYGDCEREARLRHGDLGVALFWLQTLADLAVSIPLEHVEVNKMSRSFWIRASGVTTILGGALFLTGTLVHPAGVVRAIVPGSIACLVAGIIGLNVLMAGRQGRLGRLALALGLIGLGLGFVGMLGSWLGVLSSPLATVINTGEHAGLVFIGAGLVLWGLVAFRRQVLGPLSFTPLLVGVASLTGIVFLVPGTFSALENSAFPSLYAGGWMLLGLALATTPLIHPREAHAG